MDLNKVMLIGRLTRDPESRTALSGQNVCSFGLATNRIWTDSSGTQQKRVEYHNIVAWGKLADICNQYLSKGRQVFIEGRLQTREWEGQDGVKRSRTEIITENMIMLGSKPPQQEIQTTSEPKVEEEKSIKDKPPFDQGKEEEINIEDIPF